MNPKRARGRGRAPSRAEASPIASTQFDFTPSAQSAGRSDQNSPRRPRSRSPGPSLCAPPPALPPPTPSPRPWAASLRPADASHGSALARLRRGEDHARRQAAVDALLERKKREADAKAAEKARQNDGRGLPFAAPPAGGATGDSLGEVLRRRRAHVDEVVCAGEETEAEAFARIAEAGEALDAVLAETHDEPGPSYCRTAAAVSALRHVCASSAALRTLGGGAAPPAPGASGAGRTLEVAGALALELEAAVYATGEAEPPARGERPAADPPTHYDRALGSVGATALMSRELVAIKARFEGGEEEERRRAMVITRAALHWKMVLCRNVMRLWRMTARRGAAQRSALSAALRGRDARRNRFRAAQAFMRWSVHVHATRRRALEPEVAKLRASVAQHRLRIAESEGHVARDTGDLEECVADRSRSRRVAVCMRGQLGHMLNQLREASHLRLHAVVGATEALFRDELAAMDAALRDLFHSLKPVPSRLAPYLAATVAERVESVGVPAEAAGRRADRRDKSMSLAERERALRDADEQEVLLAFLNYHLRKSRRRSAEEVRKRRQAEKAAARAAADEAEAASRGMLTLPPGLGSRAAFVGGQRRRRGGGSLVPPGVEGAALAEEDATTRRRRSTIAGLLGVSEGSVVLGGDGASNGGGGGGGGDDDDEGGGAGFVQHGVSRVENFSEDLMDSECLLRLVSEVGSAAVRRDALKAVEDIDMAQRARHVVLVVRELSAQAQSRGAPEVAPLTAFLTAERVVQGSHPDVTAAFAGAVLLQSQCAQSDDEQFEVNARVQFLRQQLRSLLDDMDEEVSRYRSQEQACPQLDAMNRMVHAVQRDDEGFGPGSHDAVFREARVGPAAAGPAAGGAGGAGEAATAAEAARILNAEREAQERSLDEEEAARETAAARRARAKTLRRSSFSVTTTSDTASTGAHAAIAGAAASSAASGAGFSLSRATSAAESSTMGESVGEDVVTWLCVDFAHRFLSLQRDVQLLVDRFHREGTLYGALSRRVRGFVVRALLRRAQGRPLRMVNHRTERELLRFVDIQAGDLVSFLSPGDSMWTEHSAVKRLACAHFEQLRKIFELYAQGDSDSSAATINFAEFDELLSDCKVYSKQYRAEHAAAAFSAAVERMRLHGGIRSVIERHQAARSGGVAEEAEGGDGDGGGDGGGEAEDEEEEEVGPSGFVVALAAVASGRFSDSSRALSAKLKQLLDAHVLRNARRLDKDTFRQRLRGTDFLEIFHRHRRKLRRIFHFFAVSNTSVADGAEQHNDIDYREWTVMLRSVHLLQPDGPLPLDESRSIFANIRGATRAEAEAKAAAQAEAAASVVRAAKEEAAGFAGAAEAASHRPAAASRRRTALPGDTGVALGGIRLGDEDLGVAAPDPSLTIMISVAAESGEEVGGAPVAASAATAEGGSGGGSEDADADEDGPGLVYPEFLEGLVAVCVHRVPNPYIPLAARFDRWLTNDFVPRAMRMVTVGTRKSRRSKAAARKSQRGVPPTAAQQVRDRGAGRQRQREGDEGGGEEGEDDDADAASDAGSDTGGRQGRFRVRSAAQ